MQTNTMFEANEKPLRMKHREFETKNERKLDKKLRNRKQGKKEMWV